MRKIIYCIGTLFLMVFALSSGSCTKDSGGLVIPTPPGGNTPGPGNPDTPTPPDPSEDAILCTDIGQTPVVLAYYTENSSALPDATLLTHINYAHGRFVDPDNGDGGIWIDKPELMKEVIKLKKTNPKLKVLLMVGGWGIKADGFSQMAMSAEKRTKFCKSLKKHMDDYGLDGVDIDWEYPTYSAEGTGADPSDKANFNLVLKELRETLGTSKIISFASSASAGYVDWPTAIKYIDYVNVMTYDMGHAPNGHNSPLYRSGIFAHRSCDESIRAHEEAGIPRSRMNLGVPFYGKSEKETDPAKRKTELVYKYTVNYYEMASVLDGTYQYKNYPKSAGYNYRKWDPIAMVPYLTDASGNIMLSYDDPESVGYKGKFAIAQKLLGAMFWEYRLDDDNHSLLKALVNAMYGKESVME